MSDDKIIIDDTTSGLLEDLGADLSELKENKNVAEIEEGTVSTDQNDLQTAFEALAAKHGWRPEGERSAEEFISVALDKFPKKSRELEQMKTTLEELKVHMTKQEESAYNRAMADLQAQRDDAIRSGDPEMVKHIEQQQQNLKPVQELPEVANFKARNREWYDSPSYECRQMRDWVLQEDQKLANYNLPIAEHMKELENSLHKKFSDYFGKNTEVSHKANTVESGQSSNITPVISKKKTYTFKDLNSAQQQTARMFEKMNVMKVEKYIEDLVKHGELK